MPEALCTFPLWLSRGNSLLAECTSLRGVPGVLNIISFSGVLGLLNTIPEAEAHPSCLQLSRGPPVMLPLTCSASLGLKSAPAALLGAPPAVCGLFRGQGAARLLSECRPTALPVLLLQAANGQTSPAAEQALPSRLPLVLSAPPPRLCWIFGPKGQLLQLAPASTAISSFPASAE